MSEVENKALNAQVFVKEKKSPKTGNNYTVLQVVMNVRGKELVIENFLSREQLTLIEIATEQK